MKASPKFLGPMRCVKGSGFKQGTLRAPFTELPPSEEKPAEQVERFVPVLWLLLPLLFWEAPSAAGAFIHFLLEGNFWQSDRDSGRQSNASVVAHQPG